MTFALDGFAAWLLFTSRAVLTLVPLHHTRQPVAVRADRNSCGSQLTLLRR